MKKSNIYVYIELSKLVDELKTVDSSEKLKQKLKAKSAYFNIIEPRYFSDLLVQDWLDIVDVTKQKDSINNLSPRECEALAEQVRTLHQKVSAEFVE